MPARTPFVGELTSLTSPVDPATTFSIKRFNARDIMTYRNANSQVRYIMDDGDDGKYMTEKDYPMGDMRMTVVVLGLADWNITDAGNNPILLNKETVLTYLDPNEVDAIYDAVVAANPAILGDSARKNS